MVQYIIIKLHMKARNVFSIRAANQSFHNDQLSAQRIVITITLLLLTIATAFQ